MAEVVVVVSDARLNEYGPKYLRYKGKGIEELAKWGAPKRTGHLARNISQSLHVKIGDKT